MSERELGLDFILDVSDIRPIPELKKICNCHIHIHCPHCGKILAVPVRDEASIQHCREVEGIDRWMEEMNVSGRGSVSNSRMAKCIHCGKFIWCSDGHTKVPTDIPLRKAVSATADEVIDAVIEDTPDSMKEEFREYLTTLGE